MSDIVRLSDGNNVRIGDTIAGKWGPWDDEETGVVKNIDSGLSVYIEVLGRKEPVRIDRRLSRLIRRAGSRDVPSARLADGNLGNVGDVVEGPDLSSDMQRGPIQSIDGRYIKVNGWSCRAFDCRLIKRADPVLVKPADSASPVSPPMSRLGVAFAGYWAVTGAIVMPLLFCANCEMWGEFHGIDSKVLPWVSTPLSFAFASLAAWLGLKAHRELAITNGVMGFVIPASVPALHKTSELYCQMSMREHYQDEMSIVLSSVFYVIMFATWALIGHKTVSRKEGK